jgi:hypothetical protein
MPACRPVTGITAMAWATAPRRLRASAAAPAKDGAEHEGALPPLVDA